VTSSFLDWLRERHGIGEDTGAAGGVVALPKGQGAPPSADEIAATFRAVEPHHAAMLDADWHHLRDVIGHPGWSANEAFAEVERAVLLAARGHGEAALSFLLTRTAWGRGDVDDSKEPARYGRRNWVSRDLARVASKRPGAAQAFAQPAKPVAAEWFKPDTGQEKPPDSVSDLLQDADEFLAEAGGYEFLVHNLIPRTGLGQFYGDSAAGKTPFVLSLALHVAFEHLTHWFGHEVDVHGPVVYMIGEGRDGLKKRLRAELRHHGIELGKRPPLVVTRQPGQLCDAEDAARWLRAIRKRFPAGIALLVVDTQAQNFGPGNESATDDMNRFVQHLTALSRQLRCCCVPVHHMGHGDKTRMRGSSVMLPACDFAFQVVKVGKLGAHAFSAKAKDWAEPEPLRGELQVVTVGQDEKGRDVTTVVLRSSSEGFEAVVDLSDLLIDPMLAALWKAAGQIGGEGKRFSRREVTALAGLKRTRTSDACLDRLRELGLVENATVKSAPRGAPDAGQVYHKVRIRLTAKGLQLSVPRS
jgi:hypothetical protein